MKSTAKNGSNIGKSVKIKRGRPPKETHCAYSVNPPKDKECRAYLREIEESLYLDLGGRENTSNKEKMQISNCLRIAHKLYLIDIWINDQPGIINRQGEILPVIATTYLGLINGLSRILQSLNLKANAVNRDVSLKDYLDSKTKGKK